MTVGKFDPPNPIGLKYPNPIRVRDDPGYDEEKSFDIEYFN